MTVDKHTRLAMYHNACVFKLFIKILADKADITSCFIKFKLCLIYSQHIPDTFVGSCKHPYNIIRFQERTCAINEFRSCCIKDNTVLCKFTFQLYVDMRKLFLVYVFQELICEVQVNAEIFTKRIKLFLSLKAEHDSIFLR